MKTNSLNTTQVLLKEGARIDKVDAKGRSMLMIAAEKGFSEMVKLLLQAGADANQHNHDKEKGETLTSLSCALAAGFPDAALLLLHGTDLSCSNILNPVLKYAAVLGHVGILKALLDKVGQNQTVDIMKSMKTILSYVIEFANTDALVEILNTYKDRESIKDILDDEQELLTAVKTDKPDLLKIWIPFINNERRLSKLIIEAIITRGNRDMIRILNSKFNIQLPISGENIPLYLAEEEVTPNNILFYIPKCVEWDYSDKLEGIEDLVESGYKISIPDLITKFHAPPIHLNLCNTKCKQQLVCQLLREAVVIQKDLISKIGELFPVFRGSTAWPVGSILEGTRIGSIELDTSVALTRQMMAV